MVTLYLRGEGSVLKVSGDRHTAYHEVLRLHERGYKTISRAEYDAERKKIAAASKSQQTRKDN